ncbi:methyltransferase domain-containing protein [Amycolatopsis palatopharyngis]|uniref:methyltransferase domain-containing protein n=1 Tax=Amycolatopsis palatopharyngis TaxID=187982 RepID=UPI000E229627|nr:methyltransferase domain-containing protein [Amycolatopsis palatopharyngis]
MSSSETFQISLEAAEVYESRFVPGIFAEWAPLVIEAAKIRRGDAVLDVACGTGIVARIAAEQVGSDGVVVGTHVNESMLAVARRVRPDLEWHRGDVADLPFPSEAFDAVLCQMSLMFFPDRLRALAEMARVTTTDGTVAAVVPAGIGDQPAYGLLVDVVTNEAGPEAASLMEAYWSCGDLDELSGWFTAAGLRVVSRRTHLGTARFGSVEELVATEVEGAPLIDRIDDETYRRIRESARTALRPFVGAGGAVAAPLRGHILVAKPI